jgi:hypothetical protein
MKKFIALGSAVWKKITIKYLLAAHILVQFNKYCKLEYLRIAIPG